MHSRALASLALVEQLLAAGSKAGQEGAEALCCPALIRSEELRASLGKLLRHQGAVDASGLGGNCSGIFEIAILGLVAILPKRSQS